MKVLFLTESALPHLGGVEKHIAAVVPHLEKMGFTIDVLSRKEFLPTVSTLPIVGLLQIWWTLAISKLQHLRNAEIIVIHDVFIYYLPFALLFPRKKIITIFHGYEKVFPPPAKNIFYKQLAQKFSRFTISVGSYINQYYHLENKNNHITYGGVTLPSVHVKLKDKSPRHFLFLGRLEKDTGLPIFLEFLDILKEKKENFTVAFCGQGPLAATCQHYGQVLGWKNPRPLLRTSSYCFAGGYLSILEAMAFHNYVLTAYDNPLKKEYLLGSPFANHMACGNNAAQLYQEYLNLKNRPAILRQAYQLAKRHSWLSLAELYAKILKN